MEETIQTNGTTAQSTSAHSFMDMMRSAFERTQSPVHIKEIDVMHLAEKIQSGSAKLLDVRTPGEFAQGHVENSFHLSLQELNASGPAALSRIPFSKDDEIYVICRSGNRSAAAVSILNALGYSNAHNVRGGIISWIQSGFNIRF